jgi:hypothetical protein
MGHGKQFLEVVAASNGVQVAVFAKRLRVFVAGGRGLPQQRHGAGRDLVREGGIAC